MPAVTSKNRPLYVLPSESKTFIVPETESALRHVTLTGVSSVIAEPNPVPAAVQPPTSTNNNRNGGFNAENRMPRLLVRSCKRKCRRTRDHVWPGKVTSRFRGEHHACQTKRNRKRRRRFNIRPGVGAPGVPADGELGDPDVDQRFLSAAMPRSYFGGVKISF
jgi:hypothetical protein